MRAATTNCLPILFQECLMTTWNGMDLMVAVMESKENFSNLAWLLQV